MGLRRFIVSFCVFAGTSAQADELHKKWLNVCAREAFEVIFSKHEYSVKGPFINPRYRLEAEAAISHGRLDDKPRLTLNLYTKAKDGTRHVLLRGSEQFEDILRYFEGEYVGINALWFEGDNLNEFNRLTGAGLTPEEAARQTWTGKQALKNGFTDVHFEEKKGQPGAYRRVSVFFDRPGATVTKAVRPFEVSIKQDAIRFVYTSEKHRFQSIHAHLKGGVLILDVDNRRQRLPESAREQVIDILEYFQGRFSDVRHNRVGLSKRWDDDPVDAAVRAYRIGEKPLR